MKLSDKLIVFTNIVTGRTGPFLVNLTDFFIVLAFCLSVYNFTGLIETSFVKLIITLVSVSIITHFLYSIIYVINDFVDYNKDAILPQHILKNYKFRPLIYFKRNKLIALALVCWYSICALLILNMLTTGLLPIVGFIILFALFSFVRSFTKGKLRIALFGILRFFKYLCLITVLNLFLFNSSQNEVTIPIILGAVLPYTIYNMISYNYKNRPWKFFSSKNKSNIAILLTSLAIIFLVQILFSTIAVVNRIVLGYGIIIPGIIVRFLPSKLLYSTKIFTKEQQNYRNYLLQLVIALVAIFLLCIFISYSII